MSQFKSALGFPVGALAWLVVAFCALPLLFAATSKLGDLDSDGVLTVLDLARLNAHIKGTAPLDGPPAIYADVNQDGFVNDSDIQVLVRGILGVEDTAVMPLAGIRETSPSAGEGGVAVTREAIVRFTMPLSLGTVLTTFDQNTQLPGHLYAEAGGRKLLTRAELSGDRLKATLFFLEPVPASSRVIVTLNTDGVLDLLGRPIDPDGDGQPGGALSFSYDTVPISPVSGTGVIGQVYASEVVSGQSRDTPLAGVTITVDGAEESLRTVTGPDGRFSLNPCPAGRFFVFIDGRTARNNVPAGAYYAFVGKAWEAEAGKVDNPAAGTGKIYLPLIPPDTLKSVSATQDTRIEIAAAIVAKNPALKGVGIVVPANSIYSDTGTRGGKVGIAAVSPDRLPEPLPLGLGFPLVITIQTDGATNFDRPVPVSFPNLIIPGIGRKLNPGEKSALWSFNHDTGKWEIQGPMTATEDGSLVVTDAGVGVRQPGWHGSFPGVSAVPPEIEVATEEAIRNAGDGGVAGGSRGGDGNLGHQDPSDRPKQDYEDLGIAVRIKTIRRANDIIDRPVSTGMKIEIPATLNFTLDAEATPLGGRYEWSVGGNPEDAVPFTGGSQNFTTNFKSIGTEVIDKQISVTYILPDGRSARSSVIFAVVPTVGSAWAKLFSSKDDATIEALRGDFKLNFQRFWSAVEQAEDVREFPQFNAMPEATLSTAFRSQKKAYLMHYSWKIGMEAINPEEIISIPDFDPNVIPEEDPWKGSLKISWLVYAPDGSIDFIATKKASLNYVSAIPRYVYRAAYPAGKHPQRKAVDITVKWSGTLKIRDASGNIHFLREPRESATNAELWRIGDGYKVYKLPADRPHWEGRDN